MITITPIVLVLFVFVLVLIIYFKTWIKRQKDKALESYHYRRYQDAHTRSKSTRFNNTNTTTDSNYTGASSDFSIYSSLGSDSDFSNSSCGGDSGGGGGDCGSF